MFDKLRRMLTPSARDRILQKIKEAKENQRSELDLSNDYDTPEENKLTEIPEEVFKLKTLKKLNLGHNKISHLPESLGNLTSLSELYLYENQLMSLPESLGNLTSLNRLSLEGNPLQEPPLEIAEKGVQAINGMV